MRAASCTMPHTSAGSGSAYQDAYHSQSLSDPPPSHPGKRRAAATLSRDRASRTRQNEVPLRTRWEEGREKKKKEEKETIAGSPAIPKVRPRDFLGKRALKHAVSTLFYRSQRRMPQSILAQLFGPCMHARSHRRDLSSQLRSSKPALSGCPTHSHT